MKFEMRDGGFGYPRDQYTLQNVSLSMDKPEVLPMLGVDGAGKITLPKCMLGLLEWRTGGTHIDRASTKETPHRLLWQKIGYVPQAKAPAFAYRAEDMVPLGRNAHPGTFGQPKKEGMDIALAHTEEMRISYLGGRLYSRISEGEFQIVLIARALATNPFILALDEPESNLDFGNQLIVLETTERLCREKSISAVMNAHYPRYALSISQKVLLLTPHDSTMFGSTKEILSESHLDETLGVEVKPYPLEHRGRIYTCALSAGLKEAMERGA